MSPALLVELGIGAAGLGLWFLAFWGALLYTRPRPIAAAPPTQDFGGAEPPAVVSMITGRWELTEDAAESTFIDLAARRVLEFRQPGNDPLQTTVHVREERPSGLNRYETMIFERVRRLAVGGTVPLTALTFRDPAEATSWTKRLNAAIVADARSRGLSRRRFSPAIVAALTIIAAVPSIAAGLAVYLHSERDPTSDDGAWVAPIFFVWFALGFFAAKSRGERDTTLGREVAARWLGLKRYLRAHESFADLPPAAVTVWDRYLSYGDAVGATRVCSAVIDLGMGNRGKVWSSFGGTWRRVRVRYPRFFPRYGQKALRLVLKAVGALAVVTLLVQYGHFVRDLAPGPVTFVLQVLVVAPLVYAGYSLIGVVVDLATPVTVRGEVLWVEVWKSTTSGDNTVPWLHYLAVDEGREDRAVAWACPSPLAGRTRPGDVVTLTARRWTRRVLTLQVEQQGRARAAAAAAVHDEDTEKLILREMSSGLQGLAVAAAMHEPEVYPGRLLTTDEVTRVLGAPAALQDTGRAMAVGAMAVAAYQTAAGSSLVVTTASGTAASELAIRVHRGGLVVPGVGDEAYTSGAWAVARRGRTVVRLELRTGGPVHQQALTWLLSQAMSRLPMSAAPL
ncbi:DUF2207 family protein [Dactylosporangium sucinum]|uniref:Predicted membrane protein YciQ-like C-terminal domain-containing protein n=1 Tax=Dactylosporangium sucinum TaxID=1424081 RepID=A0A917WLM0_9ACTN|nr:DUF2207 domain-containing protein [Dactylosporangium sucinum]GGM13229.1 hypothetical protein GCM10007977_012980 [Dactylosporangium sucinum]